MRISPGPGKYYKIKHPPKKVITWLRYIVSAINRYYEDGHWYVSKGCLEDLLKLGYSELNHIDYSDLSYEDQIKVASFKRGWSFEENAVDDEVLDPYATLHLLPTAPLALVHAAWKTLAKEYHPDTGGDEDKFKELLRAYNQIKNGKDNNRDS